jgi:hypothetical protein
VALVYSRINKDSATVNEWEFGAWPKSGSTHVSVFQTSINVVLSMASIQAFLGSGRSGDTDWGGESTSINRIGVAALISPVVIRSERSWNRLGGLVNGETITTTADLGSIT